MDFEEASNTCHCEDESKSPMTTKRKLLCLLSVALLAFLSIIIISHQLISRHLSRIDIVQPHLTILTLEEWAEPHKNHHLGQHLGNLGTLKNLDNLEIAENGIFWSHNLEHRIFSGPSDAQVQMQMQELRQRTVQTIDHPDWLHCGREKNRFVHFHDGTHACARFRANHAEFVQGEVMAFYLARLLGITNTPTVVLSKVKPFQIPFCVYLVQFWAFERFGKVKIFGILTLQEKRA